MTPGLRCLMAPNSGMGRWFSGLVLWGRAFVSHICASCFGGHVITYFCLK